MNKEFFSIVFLIFASPLFGADNSNSSLVIPPEGYLTISDQKLSCADSKFSPDTIEDIGLKYGVHFDEDMKELFGGETYTPNPVQIQILREIQREHLCQCVENPQP